MLIMGLSSLIYIYYKGKNEWNNLKTKQLFLTSSIFFIFLISALYSINLSASLKYIKQYLPVLVMPVFFLSGETILANKPKLEKLFDLYILALLFLLLFCNIYFFKSLYIEKATNYDFRVVLEDLTDLHGTYLTMWIGFGVLLLFNRMFNCKRNRMLQIIILSFLVLYFIYWLILVNARMPLLATGMTCFLFLLFKFKLSLKKCLGLSLSILIVFFILFHNEVNSKLNVLRNYKTALPVGKYENNFPSISSEHIRSGVYYCSYKIISSNPLMGVGIGDVDNILQNCYDEEFHYTDVFKIIKYNSHSQYLLILLSSGIVGFLIFAFSFFLLIQKGLSKSSYLYFCFLIFISLCFCFENILSRHDGMIFFSLFNSILFFYKDEIRHT